MIFEQPPKSPDPLRAEVQRHYRIDEETCVDALLDQLELPREQHDEIEAHARRLVEAVRAGRVGKGGIDAFMLEYELSSEEGIALMCLAEALLRVPDSETIDKLIRDKLGSADWEEHLGHSNSPFVNASTWGLMLTGRVIKFGTGKERNLRTVLGRLVSRSGEPFIRQAVRQAMNIMGRQFVLGRDIDEGQKRARGMEKLGYRYSYDMLGEGARTEADAKRYYDSYANAIKRIGAQVGERGLLEAPGISVKLTALHPRFEFAQKDQIESKLLPRTKELALMAKQYNIGFNIDAEEAERLEPTMDVLEALATDPDLSGWDGLGIAIQAYQKRTLPMIDWMADLGRRARRRFLVRLVKGAYWDTEVKLAQQKGLEDYPVFTRKANTDVSYLACARRLLANRDVFYPQFATHNAHTVAAVCSFAGDRDGFEFQRLHGMGEALYNQVLGSEGAGIPVRIYAPVGSHEDLLPYLVRRLLENGANSSFVNRLVDDRAPIDEIVRDPIDQVRSLASKRHARIPLPKDLLGSERVNSRGIDLSDITVLRDIDAGMDAAAKDGWHCAPIIGGKVQPGEAQPVLDPSDHRRQVGTLVNATTEQCDKAMAIAGKAQPGWDATPADDRAAMLDRTADILERDMARFMAIATREAGKNLIDGVAEVREAADFCRYYAARARADFSEPMRLPGPTGELNQIALHGRGVFVCISPWNFPLAIFTGQIAAALVAGNSVIAKPAEQTPLMAFAAVQAFHEAGIPGDVLHLIPGRGEDVGPPLINHEALAGVAFTGGTDTAKLINQQLANRAGPILPLIAETGGQNAMLVDSSALPEQVVSDIIESAFQSAGQRCSALRVLFIQTDIADKVLKMLAGAMEELRIGDPALIRHDIGPVIDEDSRNMLEAHAARMEREGRVIASARLEPGTENGTFFTPRAYELDSLSQLEREVFGPILHVVRFRESELDQVIENVNATGYGLTLGIHSRIEETIEYIHERLKVGNTYVNRDQIGAMVGQQPFGGEGLSGTGPKAGGPRYLYRFATERALCIDTTAQGGNAALMSLDELDMEDEEQTEAPQKALG
ncbi:MAG: bifunctional proline dehydrogenase/L-glutamate gamma-semialdehyde dehydrogenase PutA [Halofilum sp. (in: g-proteobacteria)]|nr:bifunctional proline dehydrogenase/L-glutamate gamma-semialdehyde dehydrogenase PutA [Halofilum sp. (in: g-proteobacteria)]